MPRRAGSSNIATLRAHDFMRRCKAIGRSFDDASGRRAMPRDGGDRRQMAARKPGSFLFKCRLRMRVLSKYGRFRRRQSFGTKLGQRGTMPRCPHHPPSMICCESRHPLFAIMR
jgi:hypothetical protein